MKKGKQNIIKQYNFSLLIPQIAIFTLLAFVLFLLNVPRYLLLSLSLYFLLSGYLKIMIPKWHRKGLFYLRKGELNGAIFAFEKSYNFFSNHLWIDVYRAFTLLSISRLSYREMALINIIYCYQNLNKMADAEKVHKKLAKEFPDNVYVK